MRINRGAGAGGSRRFQARVAAVLAIGVAGAATVIASTGCGGGGGGSSTQTPGIAITAAESAVTLAPQNATNLSATVTGTTNTAVIWTVDQGVTGGTVTSTGLYTAPAVIGTYYVTATSAADPAKSVTFTITVSNAVATPTPSPTPTPVATPTPSPIVVAVTVGPTTATVPVRGTRAFVATVTGTSNTSVGWSVTEGATGGTISSAGLFTASSTAGTYHVVATSLIDSSKSATATVTVQGGGSTLTIN